MRALLATVVALSLTAPTATIPASPQQHSSASHGSRADRSSGGESPGTGSSSRHRTAAGSHRSHVSTSPGHVPRDANGRIHRSPGAKVAFRRSHPCPSTGKTRGACPGYEVDHVEPLACGGADESTNMQWLTTAANRAKGSEGCRR